MRDVRPVHRSVRLLTALALVAATAVVGLVAAPSPAGADSPARPRVTVIGDSTLLGMRNDGAGFISLHHELNLQAASCRRLIAVSCDIPFRPINTIEVMRLFDGRLGDALVIMAGYDDFEIAAGVDTIVAEARRQGVQHVVWLTYMEDVPYTGLGGLTFSTVFKSHNNVLRQKAAADSLLSIADWNAYADPHPEWFSSDGIHLSARGSGALGQFIADSLDDIPVSRCAPKAAGGTLEPGGAPTVPSSAAAGFHPITPTRVLDTREGATNVGTGRRVTVELNGVVPSGAVAVAANVTAVDTCAAGFVTAHACGGLPLASNLNPLADSIVAGHVVAPLAPGTASFCITTSSPADLVVDVTGWYGGSGDGLVPVPPRRLLDTRTRGARVRAGTAVAVSTSATSGHGAVLNVTTTESTAGGFLTAYPATSAGACDPALRPLASNLNAPAGATLANLVQVPAGGNGVVCIFSSVDTHVVVDQTGAYVTGGGAAAHATAPTRLVDTRDTDSPVGGGTALAVTVPQSGAAAAALNVTAVGAVGPGFVTAYPAATNGSCASAPPLASMLNHAGADATPNLTITAVGGRGVVCLYAMTTTHLVVDQTAWFG